MIKKKILYIAVVLSFIFGLAIGLFGRPTIYAKADVYTDELYIYQVNNSGINEWLSVRNKFIEISPRSSNVGYIIYSDEFEYPIIIYSRIARFEMENTGYIRALFLDDNELGIEFSFDTYTFYVFCNSRKIDFNNQFNLYTNTGMGMAEFTENILTDIDPNNLNIDGFSFINNDNERIFKAGFDAGKEEGRTEGYNEALNEGANPLNSPFSFVYYFMNYEILPNFKMFYLFLIGIGAVLFRIIIKAGLI